MYDVLSSRHERVKRRVANKKQSKSRDPVLEPVQPNNKKLITVDPASFSSMLSGVFDSWYKQRFGQENKKTTKAQTTTTKLTTLRPTTKAVSPRKSSSRRRINKKALFNEFLALAMEYFKPNGKKKTKAAVKSKQIPKIKATVKSRKTAKSKKQTHPPVLTRNSYPTTKTPNEHQRESKESLAENSPASSASSQSKTGGAGGGEKNPRKQRKKKGPAVLQRSKAEPIQKANVGEKKKAINTGPPIDPEFLADINEVRALQGLPELTADQVDAYGNILQEQPPSPPPTPPLYHGHSHGHSHSHDFGHGHSLDHGLDYGMEAYVQASIRDTHRRAHAIAGPLNAGTHRELHRLLKNRERDLRREALLQRSRRLSLGLADRHLPPIVDTETLADIAGSEAGQGQYSG